MCIPLGFGFCASNSSKTIVITNQGSINQTKPKEKDHRLNRTKPLKKERKERRRRYNRQT